jgi:NADPH-dependent 2,4-dienoyl-CoA reductase/sulfur reductase-like enzyme/rhodanese-related sulfurtransferase
MNEPGFQNEPLKFASLLAHQLQSPLNAVSAALQTVLGEFSGPLLPRQRGTLERANERCDEAIRSVRRMLGIIRAGVEPGQQPPASLAMVARQVQARLVPEAARRDIAIRLEFRSPPVLVHPSEAALTEALGAVLGNAVKYTPDHGRVAVTVAPGAAPDRVRVEVADSGIGIPEGEWPRIFEPFFRSTTARQSARPGVGLGLAFVKSVVVAVGGTVTVGRSAALGGAEFVLELPVAGPEAGPGDAGGRSPLRVVIVGGVTAGPKAAAKIIRLRPEADVTIIERGSVMSYAGCGLPHYVAGTVRDQKGLISGPAGVVRDPVFFRNVMNVHVMNQAEAVELDRTAKRIRARNCLDGTETWLPYDKAILATGASALVPPDLMTGLRNVFTLHGMKDAEGIRSALGDAMARDVVIVGGGLIGIEMTEALARKGARVTIVERLPRILSILDADMARLVERHLESHGVRILTGTAARGLEGDGSVERVLTDHGAVPANLVILACGIRPNVELARRAGLALGETGALRVDPGQRTSDPDIYAAGDCVETVHRLTGRPCYIPLGSTATKQGRVAAVNLCGGHDVFPGVLGSSACKVFDFTVARTGLGEAEARALGHDVMTALVPGPDRAPYMPAVGLLLVKLVVDRASRRLLGAQAIGPGAADKRIDGAALAIAAGRTVDELADEDLCYAPSFSTAVDNLLTAAQVARNKLDGRYETMLAAEAHDRAQRHEPQLLLDVRTPEEYERQRLPGTLNVPLGALRERLLELPRDRDLIVVCDVGARAYEGALILRAAGLSRVWVLEGGMAAWPYEKVE